MAHIPKAVLKKCMTLLVLKLLSRGKVRDTYELPGYPKLLLVVATDRISIFDFVLNAIVRGKGEVLNAMNIFWRLHFGDRYENDLVAYGAGIDKYLPEKLRGDPDLQKIAIVVRRFDMVPIEGIVRGYLLGSGWEAYKTSSPRMICGVELPDGLVEGSKLPKPIFTPTDKAKVGHDVHISAASVEQQYPGYGDRCVRIYSEASAFAESRGMILADTKLEGSISGFGDEWFTPDSSRYWQLYQYLLLFKKGKLPSSVDKQFVRNIGKLLLIERDKSGRKREPKNFGDRKYVESCLFPDSVINMTARTYRYPIWSLSGFKLEEFQRRIMGVKVPRKQHRIEIVVGSKSDLSQLSGGLATLDRYNCTYGVSVLSCHRNADLLPEFCSDRLSRADVIISAAGKAAALPGVLKSQLCALGKAEIPVLGVALKGETPEDDRDATGSIKGLPGQPVELNKDGEAFFGAEGFAEASKAAAEEEFVPKNVEPKKAEFDVATSV